MEQPPRVCGYILNVICLDQPGGDHGQKSCNPIFLAKPLAVNIMKVLVGPGAVVPPFGFLHTDDIIAHLSGIRFKLLENVGRKSSHVPCEGTPGVWSR